MTFPQGGDFVRDVSGDFIMSVADRRICRYNNGSDICDKGYKLKYPGYCLTQAIGVYNSTDDSFQPTYPVCTSDFVSLGYNKGIVFSTPEHEGNHTSASVSLTLEKTHKLVQFLLSLEETYKECALDTSLEKVFYAARVASGKTKTHPIQMVPGGISSFWRMSQFNPGVLPHWFGVTSGLFAYDVFSGFIAYNKRVIHVLETLAARLKQEGSLDSPKNIVTTDYYTSISGESGFCVGDETPPYITLYSPTVSGAHLCSRDQVVDFSLADAVGGVDLASLYVSVSSTVSGSYPLLVAGADQTGGQVGITGDSRSYRITYTPDFLWAYNERVVVSISGSDLPPTVDGDPFYCGAAEVNTFLGDIPFQVLNFDDFSASLDVVGDVAAPYLSTIVPGSGTSGNSVLTPVVLGIADDLTGVNLESLYLSVDGIPVVVDGVPQSGETSVMETPQGYAVAYSKRTAFTYGSEIPVVVYAEDKVAAAPNVLSTTYSFSCISDSTLVIENFVPPVGTTHNVESYDIEVDIRDDTYGVDESQCFLVVNGETVSGTQTPLASGVHLSYHPPNDFISEDTIYVVVHGVNGNAAAPVVREALYTLYPGYRVSFFNEAPYRHYDSVSVFVGARNREEFPKDLSTGYFFTTYSHPQSDLGAEIFAVNPTANLSASLTVVAPEHRYGQTVTVEFFVKDLDGHELGPYTYTYTIENRPDQ